MRLLYFGLGVVMLCGFGLAVLALSGRVTRSSQLPADVPTRCVTLRWQRLVDARNKTCPRCASTEEEVKKAFAHLRQSLAPAGVEVRLETERLSEAAFLAAPLESNKIWVNGRLLEDWLGARTSSSVCCASCGDNECRTVAVGGQIYEAIPAALIVRAGLIAAADELRSASSGLSSSCSPSPR